MIYGTDFSNYRSPFNVNPADAFGNYEHRSWFYFRQKFATTGESKYLDAMLSYVSNECPPDAPNKDQGFVPSHFNLKLSLFCFLAVAVIVITSCWSHGVFA